MKPREWQRDVWSGLLPSLVVVFVLLSNGIRAQDSAAGSTSSSPVSSEGSISSPSSPPSVDQASTACEECSGFTGGSIALAVFLTLVVLLCLQCGAYLIWRHYAKNLEGQHLVLLSDPEKGESAFAFDNPGFKEGPSIQPCADKESNNKLKWPRWNALNNISLGQPVKVKAMDDTYPTHPQLNIVPLRSHDFTGLGFNICGNMRDGIFVKDVLHRGPASESGRIFTGDRIDGIKISFRHMVFEDALTILSYASPYEVELSVEPRASKKDGPGGVTVVNQLLQSSSPSSGGNSTGSQSGSRTLSHPFFKSHSITDIYKIAKTSNRRSGDPLNDPNENKPLNSLERRSKFSPATEHEKTENAKNSFLEHNCVRTNDTFTEIRLDEPDAATSRASPNHRIETSTASSSPSSSSTNVKAVLAKSIKNLKDKLHHSLLSDEKDSSTSAQSTLEKKTKKKRESPNNFEKNDDGFQTMELFVPDKKESSKKAYLFEELIVQDPVPDGSDTEDPIAAKRNKRKAPKPPRGTLNDDDDDDVEMIMMMRRMESGENSLGGRKMSDSQGSVKSEDSTTSGGKHSGTTIELNSSHITVHQAPVDSESRKASSLGDLSRFENSTNGVTHLERAVSLDLADGGSSCGGSAQSSKKRKAPMPPQEDCLTPYKEARLESAGGPTTGGGTLKKSSVWGNLEDVIQNECDSDADLGISGCSTPEKSEDMVTSTPFKFSSSPVLRKNENGISEFQVNSSNDWDKSDFVTALNGGIDGDDTPPELPSSPMPPMSSFITEIQVVTAPKRRHGDSNSVNEVIHLDSTEKFLDHIASSGMMLMNNSSSSPPLSFEENEMAVTLSMKNDATHENKEKISNTPSMKEVTLNINHSTVVENVAPKPPPRSDRESSHSKLESKSDESNDSTTIPTTPTPPISNNKSPNSRPPSSASTGSGKTSGGNVSVTSIKGQSRIPVRASGARSPGSTLSPSSDKRISKISRNGHSSP